jgi:hypothetical protein
MTAEQVALFFAVSSTALYVGWGIAMLYTQWWMGCALLNYASANVFLSYPIWSKFIGVLN